MSEGTFTPPPYDKQAYLCLLQRMQQDLETRRGVNSEDVARLIHLSTRTVEELIRQRQRATKAEGRALLLEQGQGLLGACTFPHPDNQPATPHGH